MSLIIQTNAQLDVYQFMQDSSGPGYSIPADTTDDSIFPYGGTTEWWRRWRALADCYFELIEGRFRDYLFGNRQGDFFGFYFDRDLLTPVGLADTDLALNWMVRDPDTGTCYLVDFEPHILDAPLAHIQFFGRTLDPAPFNRD